VTENAEILDAAARHSGLPLEKQTNSKKTAYEGDESKLGEQPTFNH
jgi:hypothetical protein